jgi:TetR/AcrR family transcriptional regulator, fatty acid metabolism regulator protein
MSGVQDQVINPFSTPLQNPGSEKKLKILAAAEEIISRKGFKETTISEIASQAGVNDSVIYRYFKGKDDLLFAIIEERLKEGLALLDRDLQGLIDPKSRLRKLMWGNLSYQIAYSAYSRILLFECRPSARFYSSPAARLLQDYVNRLNAILELGVKERAFRGDIPLSLMRDMVLGVLDMTTIGFHELKEVEDPTLDFEEAAALMELIIIPKREAERVNPDKSSIILQSAERIIAHKGFRKAKMSEIAQQAGVGDGTVYEYFANKDVLLFSIPQKRFDQFLKDLSGIFHPDSLIGKLKKIIKFHFYSFLADPDFTRIFVRNLFLNKAFYRSDAHGSFRSYYKELEDVIEEGKNGGVFRPEINSRVFRNLFLGTFFHLTSRWLVDNKKSEIQMIREVNDLADLLTEAVLNDTNRSN